jgi:hypothetical protein
MRTFLRDVATGQYFRSLNTWTPDLDEAFDFGLIDRAMKLAQKTRLPGLELVLSLDGSEQETATPFEKFVLGLTRRSGA